MKVEEKKNNPETSEEEKESKRYINKLLINGFLLSDFDNAKMIKEIKNNLSEYWG